MAASPVRRLYGREIATNRREAQRHLTDPCVLQHENQDNDSLTDLGWIESAELKGFLYPDRRNPQQLDSDGATMTQLWYIDLPDTDKVLAANAGSLPESGDRIRFTDTGRLFQIVSFTNQESYDVLTTAHCTEIKTRTRQ